MNFFQINFYRPVLPKKFILVSLRPKIVKTAGFTSYLPVEDLQQDLPNSLACFPALQNFAENTYNKNRINTIFSNVHVLAVYAVDNR